jgi:hypothetical protein
MKKRNTFTLKVDGVERGDKIAFFQGVQNHAASVESYIVDCHIEQSVVDQAEACKCT